MMESATSKTLFLFFLVSLSRATSAKYETGVGKGEENIFKNLTTYFQFLGTVFNELGAWQDNSSYVSYRCRVETRNLVDKASAGDSGALKFFDATGKPSSGILEGGISFIGFYSECINAVVDLGKDSLKGKYCLLNLNFSAEIPQNIPQISWLALTVSPPKIGLCIPAACSKTDLEYAATSSLNKYYENVESNVSACDTNENGFSKDAGAITVLCIIYIFVAIAVIASVLDFVLERKNASSVNNINAKSLSQEALCEKLEDTNSRSSLALETLLAFSFIRNGRKLFNVESKGENIKCLHGLKFLSMVLIILGHTFSFGTQNLFLRNPQAAAQAPKDFLSQIFANGTLAVDTFYLISGILVCFVTLKGLEKSRGKFNIFLFYIHRYFRLTPLLAIVIVFCAFLLPYVGWGPNWFSSIAMYDKWCHQNGWLNVLYLHNFINTENMCLSHSWYLATDMQFYIVVPLILLPLYKSAKFGFIMMGIFLFITTITTAVLTAANHYPAIPYINNAVSKVVMDSYYKNVYIKPYCRMGPYIVGLAVGYLFLRKREMNFKKITVALLWILSITVGLLIIYLMWPANKGHLPTNSEAAAYSALARTFWGICLSWLVIANQYGYGGIINKILSVNLWAPLSRLTYAAYLIHPVVMNAFYGSLETVVDFSPSFMVYLFIGNSCLTYLIAIPLTLIFESPIISLEKILFKLF